MIFDVNELDMGSGAASFFIGFGAGGAKMSGTMYLLKGKNSVPVLTVEIDGQTGRSGVTEIARRMDLYGELAEDMVKTLKKTKASNVDSSEKEAPADILQLIGAKAGTATATAKEATTKEATSVKKTGKKTDKKADKTATKTTAEPKAVVKKEEAPAAEPSKEVKTLLAAHGAEVHRRKDAVQGDFETIARQKRIGVYLDFSEAHIMGRSEAGFIRYMKSTAGKKDLDPNFDTTWEEDIKLSLQDLFMAEVNKQLDDEDLSLRFTDTLDTDYVLKLEVLDIDDNGNNKINYLFVEMSTGNVIAQITLESDGGHVGRYIGLLNQGFESAAEDFCDELLDQID